MKFAPGGEKNVRSEIFYRIAPYSEARARFKKNEQLFERCFPPPRLDRQVRLGGVLHLRPDAGRLRRHRDLLLVARAEEQPRVPDGRAEHGHPAHDAVTGGEVITEQEQTLFKDLRLQQHSFKK